MDPIPFEKQNENKKKLTGSTAGLFLSIDRGAAIPSLRIRQRGKGMAGGCRCLRRTSLLSISLLSTQTTARDSPTRRVSMILPPPVVQTSERGPRDWTQRQPCSWCSQKLGFAFAAVVREACGRRGATRSLRNNREPAGSDPRLPPGPIPQPTTTVLVPDRSFSMDIATNRSIELMDQ